MGKGILVVLIAASGLLMGAQAASSNDSLLAKREAAIKAYNQAMENGDSSKAAVLLSSDYSIHGPVFGDVVPNPTKDQMDLSQYFKKISSEAPNLKIMMKEFWTNPDNGDMLATHGDLSFSVKGGGEQDSEYMRIFTFAPGSEKIQSVRWIYDAQPVREALQKNSGS